MREDGNRQRGEKLRDVSLLTTRRQVEGLVPEWTELFYKSEVPNPFAHPLWLMTWCDHYAADAEPYVVTLREDGNLVAVAPFYLRQHVVVPGLPAVTRGRLLGVTTETRHITEMAQILTPLNRSRKTLRTLIAFLATRSQDWDWLELTLPPEQGVFESECFIDPPFEGYVLHAAARPAVILPLPATWDDFRANLKPNKREDIRRGFARLKRDGYEWKLLEGSTTQLECQEQLRHLVALSRARAGGEQGSRDTPVVATTDANQRFLEDVGGRLFGCGLLAPSFLTVSGTVVAGRLVLRANKSIFLSFSGFDPAWGAHGVAATLMTEVLRASVERGDRIANLSFYPNTVKLRWSEELAFHNDFILVGTRRRSRLVFSAWWQRRALRSIQMEAKWARTRTHLAATSGPRQHVDSDALNRDSRE